MRFSECSKSERIQIVVGAIIVLFGVLLLLGLYASWWAAMLSWLRFASRLALPVALIAVGIYTVRRARQGGLDHFFTANGARGGYLSRSESDYRIAGVCGGIAQYFGIESMFVRLVAVLLGLASPLLMLIAYGVLAAALGHN